MGLRGKAEDRRDTADAETTLDRFDRLKRQPGHSTGRVSLFKKPPRAGAAAKQSDDVPDQAMIAEPDFTRRPKAGSSRLRRIVLTDEE